MRQIVLDTETTGLSPEQGHRIIEIGCVELMDRRYTGNNFHQYINPGRDIDEAALRIHGITNHFLSDKPNFDQIAARFIEYIDGGELIIQNAGFDVGFLNHELNLTGKNFQAIHKYCGVFDTLEYARKKHPGAQNNLDALCKRYQVDNSDRNLHGALLDAKLLAEVFLAMTGGQTSLFNETHSLQNRVQVNKKSFDHQRRPLRIISPTPEELIAHQQRLDAIKKNSGKVTWNEDE